MLLPVPKKEEKSCLPISACAAFIIDSSSRGCRTIHAYLYRNTGNSLNLTVWYGSSQQILMEWLKQRIQVHSLPVTI
jgi:hypothetical protein